MKKRLMRLKEIILSEKGKAIMRHTLTAIGGLMVGYGYIDESAIESIIGAIMTIYGVMLSFKEKDGKNESKTDNL
jgi:hypothetical protein